MRSPEGWALRNLPPSVSRALRERAAAEAGLDALAARTALADFLAGDARLTPQQATAVRRSRPLDREHLWDWVHAFTGVRIARTAVCEGHSAPFDLFARQVLERPSLALWHGPRGGGKSFLSAIDTHLSSRFNPRMGTRILGGSKAQSEQIYQALSEAVRDGKGPLGSDAESFDRLLKTEAYYRNGSHVSILAASSTSVRGPHVASLKLDEVDEIDPEIRESAFGMAMGKHGVSASVLMTSTWHRLGGPMAGLIEKARGGEFPHGTWCIFEVLERCPDERSGPGLEKCPECPIVAWCHSDRDRRPDGLPKAKRSDGHYPIDSLVQKARGVSARVFESDYLCLGPKAEGVWFPAFRETDNVSEAAEFDPTLPVHVAIDSGVFTAAVAFQVAERGGRKEVRIFAEYLSEGRGVEEVAREILAVIDRQCGPARRRVSTDSAGGARNPVGPTVIAEYERAGLRGERGIERWPKYPGCVENGLATIEALVRSADGSVSLRVHPRCRRLIEAFLSYRRAKRAGQWQDYPEDPQHPHEDLIDAVRGGLAIEFPEGRKNPPALKRVHAGRVL